MDQQINPSADHSPGAKQFGREPPRAGRYWHLSAIAIKEIGIP
jgi:hypothetical protein